MGEPHDRQALCQSPHSFVAIGTKALPTHRANSAQHPLSGGAVSSLPKMPDMKILLSNDDGYQAPGIVALYEALKDLADVEVVDELLQDGDYALLTNEDRETLFLSALLHDVAKCSTTQIAEDGRPVPPAGNERPADDQGQAEACQRHPQPEQHEHAAQHFGQMQSPVNGEGLRRRQAGVQQGHQSGQESHAADGEAEKKEGPVGACFGSHGAVCCLNCLDAWGGV